MLAMLLVAAIGSTAQLFAAKVPTLPGSAQVAMQAEQTGISLPALGAVDEIAVSADGVSITLPANAVTMAARPSPGKGPCVETHHIATSGEPVQLQGRLSITVEIAGKPLDYTEANVSVPVVHVRVASLSPRA